MAQLLCYARFVKAGTIVEELLFCKEITTQETSEEILKIHNKFTVGCEYRIALMGQQPQPERIVGQYGQRELFDYISLPGVPIWQTECPESSTSRNTNILDMKENWGDS